MQNITRRGFVAFGAAASTALFVAPAEAAVGYVRLRIVSGGFIVGAGSGDGMLTFMGGQYPFKIGGVSFGATIGLSETQLVGTAHHLHSPGDLAGAYSGGAAGVAVAGGGGVAQYSNPNGVILKLRGRQVGFKLSLAINGMSISMA